LPLAEEPERVDRLALGWRRVPPGCHASADGGVADSVSV
jgi:hypothetical protein